MFITHDVKEVSELLNRGFLDGFDKANGRLIAHVVARVLVKLFELGIQVVEHVHLCLHELIIAAILLLRRHRELLLAGEKAVCLIALNLLAILTSECAEVLDDSVAVAKAIVRLLCFRVVADLGEVG